MLINGMYRAALLITMVPLMVTQLFFTVALLFGLVVDQTKKILRKWFTVLK